MKYKSVILILTIFLVHPILFPHHALEYIEMESYTTAEKGQFVFHFHYDYMVEDKNNPNLDHYEFTPGLSYGITDRLMLDVHTHFAKFGNGHVLPEYQVDFAPAGPSPFIEAAAFSLQYRLTENWPVNIAVAASYEVPFNRSKTLMDGRQVYEGMLIVSKTLANHMNFCANLKFGKDGDEKIKEWALGFKTPLTSLSHGVNAGIEMLGDFSSGDVSLIPGIYLPVGGENIIFKAGLQIGLNSDIVRMNVTMMVVF